MSARISQLEVIDQGEIRRVQLQLPAEVEVNGHSVPLLDRMRPGTAFLAKPWGSRTDKFRRRMYTRSNCSSQEPGLLETFINHTHRPQSDTSSWWQSKGADEWYEEGKGLDIRVTVDEQRDMATVYENTLVCKEANLRLESDGEWEGRQFVCLAFGTGITPFLSYVRYMADGVWEERRREKQQGHMTLIASARHERQLILHKELLSMAQEFPQFFRYIPVLTQSWPKNWPFIKGRIFRSSLLSSGIEQIDLSPLQRLSLDLSQSDIRMCGSVEASRQLVQGLKEESCVPRTLRRETW